MSGLKTALTKVFCLNALQTVIYCLAAYTLMGLTLGGAVKNDVIKYFSYLASTYALIISITLFCRAIKKLKTRFFTFKAVRALMKIPFFARFFNDAYFRTRLGLYIGIGINAAVCTQKFVSGCVYSSGWLIFLALYYILLALMRFFLLRHFLKNGKTMQMNYNAECRSQRFCGFILLSLNIVLSGMMTLIVTQNKSAVYPGNLIYFMALYAFYNLINAVASMAKSKKYASPAISASRALSLTAAMVSMLMLETAMLSRFSGAGDAKMRHYMTSVTSAVICTVITVMAIYMIAAASAKMKANPSKKGEKMDSRKSFFYYYNAQEQKEIEQIVKKYTSDDAKGGSAKKIKALDRKVNAAANVASITAGITGMLVFGFGMACVTVWQSTLFKVGIIVGIVGIAFAAAAYPIYKAVLHRLRNKAKPQMTMLAREFYKEKNSDFGKSDT